MPKCNHLKSRALTPISVLKIDSDSSLTEGLAGSKQNFKM